MNQFGTDWLPPGVSVHRFSHKAMATTFELFCSHPDPEYCEQAAWRCFDLIDRIEGDLSRFVENSDISRIGGLLPGEIARVSQWTMECLLLSKLAHQVTGGAFDISLGSGLEQLELDPETFRAAVGTEGIRLDLGGIGKGYALDRAAEIVREWDIDRFLLHGGYSSVLAGEAPEGLSGWPLSMSIPGEDAQPVFHVMEANRIAMSASGLMKGPHIVNPAEPAGALHHTAAWVSGNCGELGVFSRTALTSQTGWQFNESPAAVAEFFSTALIIGSRSDVEAWSRVCPGLQCWVLEEDSDRGRRAVRRLPQGDSVYAT